ncbi:cyclase family protein [Priestia flexa]|jgi:kynurenine formamidase|uniref:Cyclase family protein n=1 Tax=Priestia flexa TaxID=86664 RepID=A0A8I1MEV0_9BACI|nr:MULTISPECIES: cyclase family protein [Priestia]MBN8251561.1 cyclase family protein [Priestia flexa]MBN8434175.1 cyclase family protein [Priestia flexa]MCA0967041.1 cyclase family protein [Priestia flexa]MDI3090985.1 cyclase family protein [Priestia megaterium]UIR31550.1 cyclase family protein [Priestia flexa]
MKIIDLTLELYDGLITDNDQVEVRIKKHSSKQKKGMYNNSLCKEREPRFISLPDHSGTHVDAPSHYIETGDSVEKINVEKMFGDSLILDVSILKEPHEPVTKDLLEEAERRQGVYVEKDDIVLIRTWEKGWGEVGFFEAQAMDESAAKWFIEKQIHAVGLDLPNAHMKSNIESNVHQLLLSNEIYIVENLINLDQLPKHSRFLFFGIPLKLKNATASPIRALSILNSQLI